MSVVAIGDNVVDCYLDTGMLYPGGNCVNVAVAVRKAGVSSAYIGALGTDAAGDAIHQALLDEGVDVSHVRKVDGTNAYATVRHEGSDRRFGPRDIGVRRFVPDSGDLSFLESFRIAHTSYCSFLEPSLADIAGRIRVSFDFDNGHETGYADDLLRHVWMAEFSGADLSHKEVREVAKWAHARGPEYVLITRGALGALLFDGHTFVHQEAQQADIVDTLGAGDAFIGRMLAGFATGEPVPDLLAAASAAASATCGTFGGFGHGVRTPDGYPPGMSANAVEVPARPTVQLSLPGGNVNSNRFTRSVLVAVAAMGIVSLAACSSGSSASSEGNASSAAAETAAAASSEAPADQGVATPGTITIGTITDAKPYAYSENGELTGFEIDLIKAAAEKAGLTPELTTMDFSALLAAVNNGQFDVVASAVGITDERKELVDFSNGYLAGYFALLTKDGKVTDLASVNGKKIGVLQGSIQDTNSATLIPGAEIVRFPDTNSATQALNTDRVEGIFIDYETALDNTKKDAKLTIPFTVPALDFPAGWAVKKGNEALLTTLNAALDELVADGTWMTLYTKYFPEAPVPTDAEMPPYIN